MKKHIFLTALFSLIFSLFSHATNVILHTNQGDIVIELDEKNAPISSQNFLQYSQSGFYNGTIFHRVIDGFMIQGGGFSSGMQQKITNDPIKNEANNGLKNIAGSVAMARTAAPHSATSQFFINLVDNDFLNHTAETEQGWGYAVFGNVVEGMDIVNKIAKVQTGRQGFHRDVPKEEIIIQRVSIK